MSLIFIECGTAMASPFNTGIQRVVRSIVREADTAAQATGHRCQPVRFTGARFVPVVLETAQSAAKAYRPSLKIRLHALAVRTDRLLRRALPANLYQGVRKLLAPHVSRFYHSTIRQEGISPPPAAPVSRSGLEAPSSQPDSVEGPAILLLLDSSWDPRMWDAVEAFRAGGGRICAVLYDLIPFTHPDTVEEHTRNLHTRWWAQAPLHLDAVICISQTVRTQYLQWQEDMGLPRKLKPEQVGYFYLGSELLNNSDDHQLSRVLLESDPFFLMVGSFEPRKNQAMVLDAFDLLWQQGRAVNLVMVGGNGWKSDAFLERVRNHPMWKKRLFLMNRATDGELVLLYSRTTALVIASIAEGFGLPIVEAFQRGTKVICSDIPVFREIAGESAAYFDLSSVQTLAQAVAEAMDNAEPPPLPRAKAAVQWLSWQDSAQQLLTRTVACCQ